MPRKKPTFTSLHKMTLRPCSGTFRHLVLQSTVEVPPGSSHLISDSLNIVDPPSSSKQHFHRPCITDTETIPHTRSTNMIPTSIVVAFVGLLIGSLAHGQGMHVSIHLFTAVFFVPVRYRLQKLSGRDTNDCSCVATSSNISSILRTTTSLKAKIL